MYAMTVSFEDAVKGVQTKIQLTRQAACDACRGTAGGPADGPGPVRPAAGAAGVSSRRAL